MAILRHDLLLDVSATLPPGASDDRVEIAATVVVDPVRLEPDPTVIVAIPGGTYHRRYWDLLPPRRVGYSQAAWLAERGVIFVACDYLGGGDSTRPDDGDFMTLGVCADAAHDVFQQLRKGLEGGSLADDLPAVTGATFVGIGQSLGGHITTMQQGRYADYAGLGVFGASPILIANIPNHARLDGLSDEERRERIMEDNAKTAGVPELPMYHGAPRENFRGIFHVDDVADDLVRYDEEQCHTLISRVSGTDGMTPGISKDLAERVEAPVFIAFGASDVSADPHAEPAAYPASPDVTVVVVPHMAHMHNFAETREHLWRRFHQWLPVVR
jgi:alpha-beta hydrolase superfamily lysophospholipase